MRLAVSLVAALTATTAVVSSAAAEDQLYQGTECEANVFVVRSAGRTVNTSAGTVTMDCPAIHNPPLTVRIGQVSGFDGSPANSVQCTLFTRAPNSGVVGFQTQSTPAGFTGFFTLPFGAIATLFNSSVGYFCHLPGVDAAGSSTINQYFVREL
jgi:hypothetical protein